VYKVGHEYQDSLHSMITWFLSPKSRGLELDGQHAVKMIAQNISQGYKRLNTESCHIRTEKIQIDELKDTNYLGQDRDYLAPVLELKEFARRELKEFLYDFLVHGSLATLDYAKGWSDFDTYLIVNKETARDASALVELRANLLDACSYLLHIDQLQHHWFLVCTEIDLTNYIQVYMPIEILKLAKSYFGQHEITIELLDTVEEERQSFLGRVKFFETVCETGILKHHAYKGEYLLSDYQNAENGMYQFKHLLNYVSIAPAYYYGALGMHCYKRDAIAKIKQVLSNEHRETLEKVTLIRSRWPKEEAFPYKSNRIPLWVREIMGIDYFKQVYEFVNFLSCSLESISSR